MSHKKVDVIRAALQKLRSVRTHDGDLFFRNIASHFLTTTTVPFNHVVPY